MSSLINKYDAIEQLILDEGLRIEAIDFHPGLDVMLIILNTKAVLHQLISSHKLLHSANKEALLQYELSGNGTGVHWPKLDEDLSLKGFLQDELKNVVASGKNMGINL